MAAAEVASLTEDAPPLPYGTFPSMPASASRRYQLVRLKVQLDDGEEDNEDHGTPQGRRHLTRSKKANNHRAEKDRDNEVHGAAFSSPPGGGLIAARSVRTHSSGPACAAFFAPLPERRRSGFRAYSANFQIA